MKDKMGMHTRAVHAGASLEPVTGAVMTPIFQTSTFAQSAPGVHKGWDYSRAGNPTRDALESALAALEGATYGLAFSSGLAAEQAIIQTLDPGVHVLVCDDVYGGTGRLFRTLFAKYSIKFSFVNMTDDEELGAALATKPDLVWIETPTNPTMKILDIAKISAKVKSYAGTVVVDNTFASPIFQNPLALGADIVIHSTTKYIGGHSDIIGGALMTSSDQLYEKLKYVQFAAGAVPGPFECFLLHRSIKTLAVRMHQHCANALEVGAFLDKHPKVEALLFPGHPSHPQHNLAKEQMSGFSGMVSFRLKGTYDDVTSFLRKLSYFTLAESLGGVESLVNHPEKMTHASVPESMRRKLGIDSQLIRLSVGIENSEDLIRDLETALT